VAPGGEQRGLRDQPYELRSRDSQPALPGALVAGVERHVERRDVEVGEVHRDLGAPELRDHPPHRLDRPEDAGVPHRVPFGVQHGLAVLVAPDPPLLPHVERDPVGQALVQRVEVDVERFIAIFIERIQSTFGFDKPMEYEL